MAAIDVDALLREVAAGTPAGENLEYDAAFREMEEAARGKPEQQMGDTVIPAEEPDWKQVREKALEVLQRSRDLRAALALTRALGQTDGLPGVAAGLELVRGYHDRLWDHFHPALDPDDGNDPTIRLNTLLTLCDGAGVLQTLRVLPLASSRRLGRVCLRDVQVANGEIPPPAGTQAPEASLVEGVFSEAEIDELKANHTAALACAEHAEAVEAFLTDKLGAAQAVSLEPFTSVAKHIVNVLAERLTRRGVVTAGGGGGGGADAPGAGPAASAPAVPGTIGSREDAIRMIDRISEYFQSHEPSSPVPLLLQRAKRLISKSFIEILKDMAPEGLPQAEKIGGLENPNQ